MNSDAHNDLKKCPKSFSLAINEAVNAIQGKWKVAILGALICDHRRFGTILKSIENITPRMLSKELKELELNGIIERKVYDTTPVTIEYCLTPSGKRFDQVLEQMILWGEAHRNENLK